MGAFLFEEAKAASFPKHGYSQHDLTFVAANNFPKWKEKKMRTMQIVTCLFVCIMALVGVSCNKANNPIASSDLTQPYQIIPADGATGVNLGQTIKITFAKSVERGTVERDFHLLSERSMGDSLCLMASMMGQGMMSGTMMDAMMQPGMMSGAMVDSLQMKEHRIRGAFTWNRDSTLCTFKPDSLMMPQTQYMIHFGQQMMQMMERRIGNMDMMAGHGNGMMENHAQFHFWTADTTQDTGSGHNGHH